MQINVVRDGQEYGPFTPDQLRNYVAAGNFNGDDLAWHDQLTEWLPLRSVIDIAPVPAPRVPAAPVTPPSFVPTFTPAAAVPAYTPQNQTLLYEAQKKSAGLAVLLNFLLPGLGYIYAGMWVMGLFLLGVWTVMFLLGFVALGITWFICGIIWLIGLVDGFLAVGRSNRKLALRLMAR